VGARVSAGFDWFRAGLSGEGGFAEGPLGTVAYSLALAEVDAEPLAHAFGGADEPRLAMRVRVAIGWAHFEGSSGRADVSAASADALAFGGELVALLRVPVVDDSGAEFGLALGGMTGATATVDGAEAATLEGLYGRLSIGFAR